MNYRKFYFINVCLLNILGAGCMTKSVQAPLAEKIPFKIEKNNHTRIDDYFWLKERTNPKVIAHLTAENAYTEKILAPHKRLNEEIYAEIKSRVVENEASAPYIKSHFEYSSRYEANKQYPIYERINLKTKQKETLIDVNKESTGSSFYESSGPIMSHDHKLMAHAYDNVGRRFYTVQVKDLERNELLPIKIENATANIIWSKDNQFFFYTKQDPETLRSYQVYRYDLKNNKSDLVFEEKDETFNVYLYDNLAKNYVFFISASTLTTEVQYLESRNPKGNFQVFKKRTRGHEYEVYDGGDRFYIKSNLNAPNFKILETAVNQVDDKFWKEIIPHNKEIYIENLIAFKDFLAVSEKKDGLDQIRIANRKNLHHKYLSFKDSTYTVDVGAQGDFESNQFRYVFESMRQPEQTLEYNVITEKTVLIKERKIPHFNPEKYKSERIWVDSRDGKKIPISVLQLKEAKRAQPVLIYAYGSYGSSMTPWFSQSIFSLVDRGFVFCIAHIRGGSELGRSWYEDGRVEHKINTFNDFIDVTEFFHKQTYIDKKNVFAMGGSAGGLLMGAITNMRPELYKGIVAQVPFVDVLTTMLDDTIPLTTGEYDEWGNPNEKKYYDYILKYSPYDNVIDNNYPNILATTGLHDSQVQYWEPAKWVAKLRTHNKSKSIILLKTDMTSGHGGASGRYEQLKEKAFEFSFILSLL